MANRINIEPENNSDETLFEDMKTELGFKSSLVTLMLKRLFRDIQKTLSVAEVKTMVARLPDRLKQYFIGEWQQNQNQVSYDHLDQWVEKLYYEDESSPDRIFYSEINILKALVLTTTKLDKVCGLLSFPGLKHSLVREIKQATI